MSNETETGQNRPVEPEPAAATGAAETTASSATSSNWNFSAMVVGLPGFGKTSVMTSLARRHLETTNGIVLAHDPMGQFGAHGCALFADAAAWRAAASSGKPMPRGAALMSPDADDVTQLAMDLGERLNTANRVTTPILVAYDEATMRGASGSTFCSPLDNRALSMRRHHGIGMIFNLQLPTQLTARFWNMSTDAYVFAQTAKRAKQLDELLFLDEGVLARAGVCQLPKFSYLHVRVGTGIVDEEL